MNSLIATIIEQARDLEKQCQELHKPFAGYIPVKSDEEVEAEQELHLDYGKDNLV